MYPEYPPFSSPYFLLFSVFFSFFLSLYVRSLSGKREGTDLRNPRCESSLKHKDQEESGDENEEEREDKKKRK